MDYYFSLLIHHIELKKKVERQEDKTDYCQVEEKKLFGKKIKKL